MPSFQVELSSSNGRSYSVAIETQNPAPLPEEIEREARQCIYDRYNDGRVMPLQVDSVKEI